MASDFFLRNIVLVANFLFCCSVWQFWLLGRTFWKNSSYNKKKTILYVTTLYSLYRTTQFWLLEAESISHFSVLFFFLSNSIFYIYIYIYISVCVSYVTWIKLDFLSKNYFYLIMWAKNNKPCYYFGSWSKQQHLYYLKPNPNKLLFFF
jgi:hypothetical protein